MLMIMIWVENRVYFKRVHSKARNAERREKAREEALENAADQVANALLQQAKSKSLSLSLSLSLCKYTGAIAALLAMFRPALTDCCLRIPQCWKRRSSAWFTRQLGRRNPLGFRAQCPGWLTERMW